VTRARRWHAAALCAGLAGTCLLAGCASPGAPAPQPPAAAATFPLATTLAATGGQMWAVVAMGGSAASQNSFWELFARPAASTTWDLATPPGVADNGGLAAAAPAAGQRLDIAFRPSQGLTFSPLALTGDGGKTWATGLIDAPVAAVPDALTADSGTMLALLTDGGIEQAAAPAVSWTPLAAPGALAATAAGRACEVTSLTAVALTATGTPLAAASCARPGIAGIFARAAGTWRAAGPAVPAPLANRAVRVLRLTGTAGADTALMQAGTGAGASLLAAWTSDGTRWTVSAPLPAGTGQVTASGTGPGAAAWILLASGRADIVSGPGSPWRELPAVPRGTAALAAGPGNSAVQALAVSGSKLTVFALTPAGTWSKTQVISVPIQYGSSS
jgi:hypothetical protein